MKKIRTLCIILLFTLLLSGCSFFADNDSIFYSFTDSIGENVTLNKKPETVAVLFSSFAEIWTVAGGEVSVTVGESVERGFASDNAILVDDGAGKKINDETLIASQPDFIIASADIDAHMTTASLAKNAGIPCAMFRVECFEDYLYMLKICTDITGDVDTYTEYGLNVKKEIESILEKTDGIAKNENILFIRSGSSSKSAKAKRASDHFAAKMLEELGAYNIADNAPILLDGLSIEEILIQDPAYIFISTMGDEDAAKSYMNSVLEEPAWQSLSAVKNGNYVYLPKELFQFKPNARWGEAYKYLVKILYPEIDFNE